MPILNHISGEQLRMPSRVDAGGPFRTIGAVAQKVGEIDETRRVAKLEFDAKIAAVNQKNQVSSATAQYKAGLKILGANFNANDMKPEDQNEAREELYNSLNDGIESEQGKLDFRNKTLLSTATDEVETVGKYNKNVLDKQNAWRKQEYVDIASGPAKLRTQLATSVADQAFDANIINEAERHEEIQGASLHMITHDATYGDLDDTIARLSNNKDTKYGKLDAETRKDGLAFALSTKTQREKQAKIAAGIGDFDLSKEVGKITTNEEATPEDIYYALGALPFEKDAERKKAQNDYMNSRVSLRTNNTTFRTMNGKVKTLLGKYGTPDEEERKVLNEVSAEKFLQEVKSVQDELLKKHLKGELNYGSYIELVDQLEPVVAQRIDEARGVIKGNEEWFGFSDRDAEAVFENAKDGWEDQQERVSDSFMNYHNSLARLEDGDKEALTQYKEDYGKDWDNNSTGRENVAKQVLIEENFRDVNSAYKLFTTYGGSDNAEPVKDTKEAPKEVMVGGVAYIETADGGLEKK